MGWKVALDIPEVERVVGDAPVLGHLTTATLLADRSLYRAVAVSGLRAETEVAIEVGDGATIAGVGVALELVDVTRPPHDLEEIVSANCFHRGVVIGPRCAASPGDARTFVNGRLRETAATPRDLSRRLRAIAELLEVMGEELRSGDIVLAGGSTHVCVGHGDHVVAEIEPLGRLELTVGPA